MKRQGYSLLELLVGMAIGSLLLTAVVACFVSSSRLLSWIGIRTDVQSSALLGLNAFAADLRESAYATLTVIPSPPALAFRTEDPATLNMMLFVPLQQFSVYYFDAGKHQFVRKIWTGTQPGGLTPDPFAVGRLSPLSPDQVAAVIGQTNGSEHAVASSVQSVSCLPASYPTSTLIDGIQVSLVVQGTAPGGETCVESVSTTVIPRNHP